MVTDYVSRSLEPTLRRSLDQFPAVVVTGPRQSGKTTLLRHVMGSSAAYVNLEDPQIREMALADPRGFLAAHPTPLILDEVQRAPLLLSYLQALIDEDRRATGRYILSGSQNLMLLENISQSLAGRAAILTLMPLTSREIADEPDIPLPWESGARSAKPGGAHPLFTRLLKSGFPDPALGHVDPALWFPAYMATYLERDLRTMRDVGDLLTFQVFMRVVASRTGCILDLTGISREVGVALNTAKAWLSVLIASHLVVLLPPYHANVGKRLTKRPKVYFTDVGLACHLTGLTTPDAAINGPMGGALFETAMVGEVYATLLSRGISPELYFWNVSGRTEVDLLVRHESRLVALEAKLNATPTPRIADPVRALQDLLPDTIEKPGYVVHPGSSALPLGPNVRALPFDLL